MDVQQELDKASGFKNLELLAKQVVEGFIAGIMGEGVDQQRKQQSLP